MGNNSINDAFKELESMSNQIKNKKQAQSQNANYDQYNELDSFSRERNERAADPMVFFNDTGNPFLGIMHFLQRKPVPPKPIDEQRLLESFSKCAKKQRNFKKMLRLIVVIIPVSVILGMLIGGVTGVILNFLPFIMVPVLIIYLIMNSVKGYNNSDYTINDYKAYVIKKAIEGQVEGLVYEPRFGLPESVYSDLNVMRHGNRYHKEDLITGKYKNVYFVQSDLKVQYESNGEHDTTTTYFRGRWIAIDYPKKFNGTVVIIDNSFAYGVKRKELEKIQLENPYFNDMFTVRASDIQLGYYLLTPQLVEKIMELKQSTNGNIIVCFKNGYLHIFINDGKDSFEPNINNVNLMGDIQKFMQDFTLVSGTIDVLDINNSVYAQGNAWPPVQAPYQNYSNSTLPNNNNSSGIGIQGGRF